jgi:hypothetical protein
MSILLYAKFTLLGKVMLSLVGLKESTQLDSACCHKQHQETLLTDLGVSLSHLTNPKDLCETQIFSFQLECCVDLLDSFPVKDALISLANNCKIITQQNTPQFGLFDKFFQLVDPQIMNHLTTLTLSCGFGKDGGLNVAAIYCLEAHCSVLQNLSLTCSKDCTGSDFFCLFTRNRLTLHKVELSHCKGIDLTFFEFIKSMFCDEQLTELHLKNCCQNVPRETGILWSFNPFSSLVRHVKTLQYVLLSFCGNDHHSKHGFVYDGRNVIDRKLLLYGLKALSYAMFACCDNLNRLVLVKMCDISADEVNRLVVSSPNLRGLSIVRCDASFSKDRIVQMVRMTAVEDITISGCENLDAETIQDILCQENNRAANCLKIVQISEQKDFKFVHLLHIVSHNHSLKTLKVERCHPSLLGRNGHQGIQLMENIFQLKNKTLDFELHCDSDELLTKIEED